MSAYLYLLLVVAMWPACILMAAWLFLTNEQTIELEQDLDDYENKK